MKTNELDKFVISASYHDLRAFAAAVYSDYIFAPHNRLIMKKLMQIESGEIKKLMINVSPRSGKSFISSELFPVWYLGRNPKDNIICSSYSQDIVEDFGRKVRNLMRDEIFSEIFNDIKLSEDSASVKKLSLNKGGSYYAVSAGSALTGKGASCITGDSIIQTEFGALRIDHLYQLCYNIKVLSFNHSKNIYEYRDTKAYRRIQGKQTYTITTFSGCSLRITPEHKVYERSKGYIEARALQRGDRVVLQPKNQMCLLSKDNSKRKMRVFKKSKSRSEGFLLQQNLFSSSSFYKEQQNLLNLQNYNYKKPQVLFKKLLAVKKTIRYIQKLRNMQRRISKTTYKTKILLKRMQRHSTQQAYERVSELQLSQQRRAGCIVLQNKTLYLRTRWKQLPNMQYYIQLSNTSYRPQLLQPKSWQFNYNLPEMSYETSQVIYDTISEIRQDSNNKYDVYDIQVEGNNNFFANGILIHNCLLIDDPHKNRAEANSANIRDKIINWYKSTAYTRLTPNGAVICISTRWHQQDLAGYLLETEGDDWDVINIPAINENGESYWPERWPIEKLNQIKKTIGSYEWSALYQQSPAPQEGGMFQYQWFEFVEALPKKRKCVRYWDRAATVAVKGNDPDYTVGIKLSKDNDGILYIEDMVRFRGSSLEVQTAIKNTASRDGTSCLIGLEQDPGQAGKAEMDNLIRTLQGFIARPYPVQKDKVTRAMPVSAQAEAGNIKILKAPWNSELLDELCTFPFAAHDDITDALSGAFGMLTSGYDMRDMVKL